MLLAANVHNNEDLLPHFILQLSHLLSVLPYGTAFLSVYESGSSDASGARRSELIIRLCRFQDIHGATLSANLLLPALHVRQSLPHLRRLAGLAARSRRSAGRAAPHCRWCATTTQISLRDTGVLLTREASRAEDTGQGCAGGVRRNASEERVHFLAAMRNKALEPLWQNASVLFRVTTHSACCRICAFHFPHFPAVLDHAEVRNGCEIVHAKSACWGSRRRVV